MTLMLILGVVLRECLVHISTKQQKGFACLPELSNP
jgi:hypothetical protein